mmetsp:Transcript_33855/g.83707  ORF Transcript_33855/g.83707 Transcript_33855/m.83707 type:complete len:222 (-) Transcript_33855:65-730(-)
MMPVRKERSKPTPTRHTAADMYGCIYTSKRSNMEPEVVNNRHDAQRRGHIRGIADLGCQPRAASKQLHSSPVGLVRCAARHGPCGRRVAGALCRRQGIEVSLADEAVTRSIFPRNAHHEKRVVVGRCHRLEGSHVRHMLCHVDHRVAEFPSTGAAPQGLQLSKGVIQWPWIDHVHTRHCRDLVAAIPRLQIRLIGLQQQRHQLSDGRHVRLVRNGGLISDK